MKHRIPLSDWTWALTDAIHHAWDGDVIVVHNAAMQEQALQIHQSAYPDKELYFEIQAPLTAHYKDEQKRAASDAPHTGKAA